MNIEERLKKLERKNTTSALTYWVLGILCVVVIAYLIVTIVQSFMPKEAQTIKFEVTGIVDDTNATSLTQVHLECIKYCVDHVDGSYGYRDKCYDQCVLLGKEGCEK